MDPLEAVRALVAIFALEFLLLAGCSAESGPSIVLITVDTLRADALDAYRPGSAGSRTPRLSRLAAQSTLFERALAPMSLTRPAHFSMFTGRYPREHGVLNNQIALPDSEQTIAEILREEGYRTGAFVAVQLLGPSSGALQGFDRAVAPVTELEWPASRVVSQAYDWLDALPTGSRFFLWVHLFDPHQPYDPPEGFRRHLDPTLATQFPALGWTELLRIARQNGGHISTPVVEHGKALYRGEVAAVDAAIGELIDKVDALRPHDRTMIVFTADHGECFENGIFFEHSECLFEGGIRVPLLVRYPRQFTAGLRVPNLVSNADIAPTILRAAGLALPDSMSVFPLQESEAERDRYVLLQNPYHAKGVLPARLQRQVVIRRIAGEPVADFDLGVQKVGIVSGDWKYLRSEIRGEVRGEVRSEVKEELYASGVVPVAEENVALHHPSARASMSALLDRALESHPLELLAPDEINPELLQSLRALGYVE